MKKPVTFRVVGRGELDPNAKPPILLRAIEFLRGAKHGDLYLTIDLCKGIGYSISHLGSRYASHPDLSRFRYKVGKTVYWGSEKTVQDLKESVNE